MEIKWNDVDPQTGQRRFLCADRFARKWRFRWKPVRRGEWHKGLVPTVAMWEHVLDRMECRYRRREGVSDLDLQQVTALLSEARRQAGSRGEGPVER